MLAALPEGSVDLCYADPPFGTGETQRLERIRTGDGEQTRRGFGGREYRYEVVSDHAYDDGLTLDAHLAAVRARVEAIHRVLAPHGSLYLHCDWRTVHHLRLLLDEVFGARRFLNELVWAYDYGGRHRDRWPRKHDTILWYARGDRWLFDREAIDRVPYMAPGLVGPEKAARGKLPTDVWWMTIVPPGVRGADRLPDPEARPAAGADRRGVEPPGRSRPRPVRGERHDRRRRRAPRPALAARGSRARRRGDRPRPARPRAGAVIRAITLDFGNTLVPVPDGALREVVGETARGDRHALGPFDEDEVNRVWSEERARQFREEVPHGREVDLAQRLGRILARLRGMPAPPDDVRWDDAAAGLLSDAAERDWAVDVYSQRVRRAPAAAPRPRARCSPPLAAALPARGALELAAGDDHRPLRRGRRAGRRTCAPSSCRSGSGRSSPTRRSSLRRATRSGSPSRARSSTSATTGRRTSSARSGPAGWRRTSGTARRTRRFPAATATPPWWPTWSWTPSASSRRRSNAA